MSSFQNRSKDVFKDAVAIAVTKEIFVEISKIAMVTAMAVVPTSTKISTDEVVAVANPEILLVSLLLLLGNSPFLTSMDSLHVKR